jgi:hypothetical protein
VFAARVGRAVVVAGAANAASLRGRENGVDRDVLQVPRRPR